MAGYIVSAPPLSSRFLSPSSVDPTPHYTTHCHLMLLEIL